MMTVKTRDLSRLLRVGRELRPSRLKLAGTESEAPSLVDVVSAD